MSRVTSLAQIGEALRTVRTEAEATAKAVEEASTRTATAADDLLHEMRRLADHGNAWAEQMESIITHVQEGLIPADKAIHAFDDGLIMFEGRLRSVRDVLADVLPTTGEVQAGIRDLVAELEKEGASLEELTARLAKQHNAAARELAELIRLMKAGRVTIEEVIRRAQELREQFPGSEGAAIADLLAEGLRDGTYG